MTLTLIPSALSPSRCSALFAAAMIFVGSSAVVRTQAAVLVNETFADGNITSDAAAGTVNSESLAWYGTTGSPVYVGYQEGGLHMSGSTTGARQALAHFTPQGQAMTLGVGETLSMSFNFTAQGDLGAGTGNLMRFGLFTTNNDAASYITSHKSTATMKFDGYAVAVHNIPYTGLSGNTVRADIMVRDHLKAQTSTTGVNGGHLLTNSTGFYDPVKEAIANYGSATAPLHNPSAAGNLYSTDTHTLGTLALSTLYTGQLTLKRVDATTMLVSSSITGGGLNVQDTYLHVGEDHDFQNAGNLKVGRSTFTFDTIAFTYNWASNAGMQEMLIDNILVTHTVPEPGRAALLGVAALFVFGRRQRRSK